MTTYLSIPETEAQSFGADPGYAGVFIGSDGNIYSRSAVGQPLVMLGSVPGSLDIKGSAANVVKLLVEAKTAQTADIVQVKNAAGAVVFSIAADGTVHILTGGSVAADL